MSSQLVLISGLAGLVLLVGMNTRSQGGATGPGEDIEDYQRASTRHQKPPDPWVRKQLENAVKGYMLRRDR